MSTTTEKRLSVTMIDSIILMLVIIAEIVICGRAGLNLESSVSHMVHYLGLC